MQVRRARTADVHYINQLLNNQDVRPIYPEQINKRDISFVAADMDNIIGFLWIGLMGRDKVGFIDHFCVNTAYSGRGIGNKLAHKALHIAKLKGVKHVSGIIRTTPYHDASAMNALKMAMGAYKDPVTYVYTDIEHSCKELGV